MPSKRMNLLHEVRFVHIGFRTTFAPVFPKLRRSEPQYYASTELDQMTTSAKKHHRLHFQTYNGALFHDKCDAGTNVSLVQHARHYPSINGHNA
jgi:hypothetical protein